MGTALLIIFLFGVVCFAILMGVLSLYNGLATAKAASQVAFSQIETDMTRRHEFVAGLADAARNYMKPERATLDALLAARQQASVALNAVLSDSADPALMLSLFHAETAMEQTLGRVKLAALTYPEFKASRNITLISRELDSLSERLVVLCRAYNEAAAAFNAQRSAFPSFLLAGFLGFRPIPLYEIPKVAEPEPENPPSEPTNSPRVFYG